MRHSGICAWLLLITTVPAPAGAAETQIDWSGHLKTRLVAEAYPDGSLFRDLTGPTAADAGGDLRLRLAVNRDAWSFNGDYEAFAIYGDRTGLAQDVALATGLAVPRLPNDQRRLFDLTHTVTTSGDLAMLHRLDRLWFGHTSERTVIRVGRQAISWGGGLFFSPFDIVNPFDPATIDTEYKPGDDMLYGQYLSANGNDLQFAYVARRNPVTNSVTGDEATAALKYHGILADSEYDLLLAKDYGRTTIGIAGNRSVGGAVLRADLLVAEAGEWTAEIVMNLSYSWTWWNRNVNGSLEYYYNGYGQEGGRYSLTDLTGNPELLQRLARGETFSLGRNYLAGGLTIELSPLWLLIPNLFANLDDGSALLQLIAQHSLGDNLTFLAALNAPLGPEGTEYGGIESGLPGRALSRDAGLFAQLAWYF